jgi:predicted ATP-grasp superfamily ATP-dependent carboligase
VAVTLDAIVLDASMRQSLVCVRSWGGAGLRVGAFEGFDQVPAFASRWCSLHGRLPAVEGDPGRLSAAVIDLARRHQPAVIVPGHDGTIEALRGARGELERHTRLALPSEAALRVAVSKPLTLALAAELGLDVPRGVQVSSVADVDAALAQVGLPAVLKPSQSWVEHGAERSRVVSVLALDAVAAHEAVRGLEQAGHGGSYIVQQWLPGSREAVSLFFAGGRVLARFTQVAHRMTPPLGGSSVVRESIRSPDDVADAAERLIRAVDLEGYSEVEFRRDAAGRPMLMEINPRLSASVEIAVRAGVDFPLLIYRWAAGLRIEPVLAYRQGVRVRWLGGDLQWLRWVARQQGMPDVPPLGRAVGIFAGDFLRPMAYDYVDRRDLRPLLVATRTFLRRTRPTALGARLGSATTAA